MALPWLIATTKGQIQLRYPASEPARELVCDLASELDSVMEYGLSRRA